MGKWRTWIGGVLAAVVMTGAGQAALVPMPPAAREEGGMAQTVAADGMVRLPSLHERAWLQPEVEEARRPAPAGVEGVELAARLVRNGGLVLRPVRWELRRLDEGKVVRRMEAPQAELAMAPGRYEVRVEYGLRRIRHEFEVRPEERLRLVFVLNVGGLRALARLEGVQAPLLGVQVEHRLLQRSADGRRKLLAHSRRQGEILRLPAGRYELESRFRPGNARVITPVRIKPGRLHGYEIAARAALGEMKIEGPWTVRAGGGWHMVGQRQRNAHAGAGARRI